jgi:nucleotide-binding universal stress UspA family protein
MYQQILVAADGSETSLHALDAALQLAQATGAHCAKSAASKVTPSSEPVKEPS